MAYGIYTNMPFEVINMITAKDWAGEPLITFENMEGKPNVEDLARNVLWLLPYFKDSPTKASGSEYYIKMIGRFKCVWFKWKSNIKTFVLAPSLQVCSGFFAADCFLYLDALLHKLLFRPKVDRGESRLQLAAAEGVRCKRAIGALRYLWRNSAGSHNQQVHELKSHLRCSPLQGRPQHRALADGTGDEDAPLSGPEIEDEGAGEEDAEEERSGAKPVADEEDGDESASNPDDGADGHPEDLPNLDADESDASSEVSEESQDSLNAPTEVMGESPKRKPSKRLAVEPKVEEPQDSQVRTGCGWLGKAYMAEGRAKAAKRSVKETANSRAIMLRDIREYMSVDCELDTTLAFERDSKGSVEGMELRASFVWFSCPWVAKKTEGTRC